MKTAIAGLPRYIVCSRVTLRPIFEFVHPAIRPNDALSVFPLSDDYSFGVLQSDIHWAWFIHRCSTQNGRPRYTSDTVFDSFPWPQSPSAERVKAVAANAVALRTIRNKLKRDNDMSLRELYRTLDAPGSNPLKKAHADLNAAVRDAYDMGKSADVLSFLFEFERQGRCIGGLRQGCRASWSATEWKEVERPCLSRLPDYAVAIATLDGSSCNRECDFVTCRVQRCRSQQ